MANKKLPGGRKTAGRVSTSAKKLVALKAGAVGVTISELPEAEKLTGEERFPVVQDKETRGATLEQLKYLMPEPIQVDGVVAVEGKITLSPRVEGFQAGGYPANFSPDFLNISKDGTYHILMGDGGELTLNLSAWNFTFNERQSCRLTLHTTSGFAKLLIQPPYGGAVYHPDGSASKKNEPAELTFDGNLKIIEVNQLHGKGADLFYRQIFPSPNEKNGASAYDIWASAQPEGSDTSEAAYLQSMEGKQGEKGDNGLSAYQIWLNEGNEGSEEDFLEWLQVKASVEIDPLKTNLLKSNAAGLFVNGVHPIIPKFSTSTLNGLLDTFKSLADGTRVYTMQVNLTNPLGITQLGGVAIHRYLAVEPQYFFTNEKGEYIPAQYFITGSDLTASSVKVTISVIMPDKPYKSWSLSTLEEVAGIEEGSILQCKVGMRLLAGTTPSQNGMS
ncbi:hypothetical protein ACXWYY_000227 [Enterobacter hormaechei]